VHSRVGGQLVNVGFNSRSLQGWRKTPANCPLADTYLKQSQAFRFVVKPGDLSPQLYEVINHLRVPSRVYAITLDQCSKSLYIYVLWLATEF
jgi:hypothetical protein